MKYLVVSDNHGDRDVLVDLFSYWQGKIDEFFHCGDSELDSKDPIWQNIHVVKGNCDYVAGYQNEVLVQTAMDRIFMTHGHLVNVRFELNQLKAKGKAAGANILLFGHTHELGCEIQDGMLILNPGSILLPRGRYHIQTYAVIESTDKTYRITYYDRSHQPLENLHFDLAKES